MNIELKRPIVFFDEETTGVDIKKDFIIEIALIKVNPEGVRQTFETLIKPPISIPPAATEVHGITDEMVKEAPAFKDIAKVVLAFIEGCDLAGFNSNRFDIPLLNTEFKRAGLVWAWQAANFLDVGNIYKIKEPRTLGAAHKFYTGEDLEEAHTAINDVEATINVFFNQVSKYEDLQGKEIADLALMSNFDKRIVDITGTFGLNDQGEIIFNFGKHKGNVAKLEKDYLQWMLTPKASFDEEVKEIARGLLYS